MISMSLFVFSSMSCCIENRQIISFRGRKSHLSVHSIKVNNNDKYVTNQVQLIFDGQGQNSFEYHVLTDLKSDG